MAIQIIDGFQVNTALPIDNRIVASGSSARNAIPYKYEGLRVFDTSDSVPYVWVNGAWQSENSSGISGAGTTNYLPVYTSSNVLGDSLLYQSGVLVKTSNTGSGGDKVTINASTGLVTAAFSGNGSLITNINASNITTGSLALDKLTNGSTGWILTGGVTSPTYVNPNQVTVGTASVANNVTITNTSTNATYYLTFVSSGAWTSVGGNSTIRAKSDANNISYNPFTNVLSAGRINYSGGALASATASIITHANLSSTAGSNISNLEFNNVRNTSGTDWLTSGYRIQSKVDNQYLAYIQFNGTNNDAGMSIGTGYQSTDGTSNTNERFRISSAGLFTFTGSVKHVSPTFTSLGSFVVGTGNLSRTNQITISSATYDRVIYVYSSSNSNNYYSTSGFFEIEVYIGGQQIYTIFHGNDSDVRPTGLGYNYILPAGLTSTINLYKGNTLAWNTGSGPTIYATSLKFGL